MRSCSSARVRESPFVCVEQTTGVLGRPEEVGGLLPARVLVSRHKNRSTVARDDLNGMVTGGDAVNERRQRPACLIGTDGRRRSPGFTRHWSIVSTPSPRMVARVAGAADNGAQILHYACVTDVHLWRGGPARFRRRCQDRRYSSGTLWRSEQCGAIDVTGRKAVVGPCAAASRLPP